MKKILFQFLALSVAATSCTYDYLQPGVDCTSSNLVLAVSAIQNPTSCAAENGSITLQATGGQMPYQYQIQGRAVSVSGSFINLSGGLYEILVTDKLGCRDTVVVELTSPDSDLAVNVQTIPDRLCVGDNGEATVSVTGGVPPYSYHFADSTFTSNPFFNTLAPGSYVFKVTDASSCSQEVVFNVTKGNSGTSWEQEIRPIMLRSCAIPTCHVPGTGRSDLSTYNGVKRRASAVKTRTANRSMPVDEVLPASDIARIACWVDEGALDN